MGFGEVWGDVPWGGSYEEGSETVETVSILDSVETLQAHAVTVQEAMAVAAVAFTEDFTLLPTEVLQITESLEFGALQVNILDAYTVEAFFSRELRFDYIRDTRNFRFLAVTGVPVRPMHVEPIYTTHHSGADGLIVDTGDPNFLSNRFRVTLTTIGPQHIGDYIFIDSGKNAGLYQITTIFPPANGAQEVLLDRPLFLVDPTNGSLQWRHVSGVRGVTIRSTKYTDAANYVLVVAGLYTKVFRNPFAAVIPFTTHSIPKPRVLGAEAFEDGNVSVEFDTLMRAESGGLFKASDYTITGPTPVVVKRARQGVGYSVVLDTVGLADGEYTVTVNASGTPKDIAGNPIDPLFNTAIFTSTVPVTERSIFTDRGPIAKPPLSLQSGTGASFASYNEVELPGASLDLSHIGRLITISGSSSNGGVFRVTGVVSATRARVKASFSLPDASDLTWDLFDPRDGQIADDPSDVTVRINGDPVIPEAVVGLLGQIILSSPPEVDDDVKVDYSWCCNPVVDFRRLNSKEFRLNAWNRDKGYGHDRSQHKYRYNNVLVRPGDYEPDNMSAPLSQPLERELHYRAFERAYTPVLNDPTLLLLNSPTHKISYPRTRRTLQETFIAYEASILPENDGWERRGAGVATVNAGRLTIEDDSSGPFPFGQPLFWRRSLDLTFDHAFAMSWRMRVSSVAEPEGVFTGVGAGYSDERLAVIVGCLDDGGVKKIGILKRGATDPSSLTAWTGGLSSGISTGTPGNLDWSVLHSYRIFRDTGGTVRVYVDGEVTPILQISADELPFLEELNAPFDQIQGAFFGSISRPARGTSEWDFVRYLTLPTNPLQTSASSYVDYEGDTLPELASKPWTPVGYHGSASVSSGQLLLDSTSASDASGVGLVGGDYRGYVRIEPLLTRAAQVVLDFEVGIRTLTHGVSPTALMAAVDDGNRLMQVALFPLTATPKLSYGGRSLPEDFSPYAWSALGTSPAAMVGRTLRISDEDVGAGRVYFIEDMAAPGSADRVIASDSDYILEFKVRVGAYTPDGAGFAGVFGQIFDGTRAVGLLLEEVAGTKYVTFHSDGVVLGPSARFEFDWGDQTSHVYRAVKNTAGDLVSLFVDGAFLGAVSYSDFATPTPELGGMVSFGSSTPASTGSQSVADWEYCNAWRVNATPKRFVGLWRGHDDDSLTGYHLPTKAFGKAVVNGNALGDAGANFVEAGVAVGDQVVVDYGPNKGVYEVASVAETSLTILGTWPLAPSEIDYRIAREIDWSTSRKFRLVRDETGSVSLFVDNDEFPVIHVGYDSLNLPDSGSGLVNIMSEGMPAIAFGSLDPLNLTQSVWDYVRYGLSVVPMGSQIAPHHQVISQWNVMGSPERLFTPIIHPVTDFKSSSTGVVPKRHPDFMADPDLRAFTVLNEGTPLVPATQSAENRKPFRTLISLFDTTFDQTFALISSLNTPATPQDVLSSSKSFAANDSPIRYELVVPDDVLYSSLDVIEQTTGEAGLLAPFGDECGWGIKGFQYNGDHCLVYDASDNLLPEETQVSTPWQLVSGSPEEVSVATGGGTLTYGSGATGATSVYRNRTPLPDHPGLRSEARFRIRLVDDGSFGLGDTKVRFGLSAPGFTVALAFFTSPLAERFVLVLDQKSGQILGSAMFDFLDGAFHTYRIVRDPAAGLVRVFIDS